MVKPSINQEITARDHGNARETNPLRVKQLFLASLLTTSLLVTLFSLKAGPLPAPGPFFHPVRGFWSNAEFRPDTGRISIPSDQLRDLVEIYYDERGVPHIFALNEYDLYFAQGYVTAKDRLFQMDLQARAAAGRLAEWMGESFLDHDLNQRRMGVAEGASRTLERFHDDEIGKMVDAYTAGVNAWIGGLQRSRFPLEYKLLRVRPEPWTPLKTVLLLKYMTQMLAGRSQDVQTSNTAALYGKEFVEEYINRTVRWTDPIIPSGVKWNPEPMRADPPDRPFTPHPVPLFSPWQSDPANGSNNWAVDGSRSASGYPILAGDPHLAISVPSIWYEIQLHTPGINTYGVSIPGTPSVILGFNENIAWSSTNTGADLLDWYEIEFRDADRNEYLHDGKWKRVTKRTERVRVRGRHAVTDTVLWTHHGPVRAVTQPNPLPETIGHAIRWIGHDPTDELRAFYLLNRAGSVEEAIRALEYYTAPAQNFALADRHGSIALQVAGRFPLRWKHQGQMIGNGRDPRHDWQGWIPYRDNPSVINPERGYVSSANQIPADSTYPYYLGDLYRSFERGKRINERLGGMERVTVDDMRLLQLDNFSYLAALALPVMLENLRLDELSAREKEMAHSLARWDYQNLGRDVAPSIFHHWWDRLYETIWKELRGAAHPVRIPSAERTLQMIVEEPESVWYDDADTPRVETLSELVTQTFHEAVKGLESEMGEEWSGWKWGEVNKTRLDHIAEIPGLGGPELFTDGSAESLNAIRTHHGPSWRMVVELGPELKSYGVYPGGPSGNPGSENYNRYTETWREGELYELRLLDRKPDADDRTYPLLLTSQQPGSNSE